MFGTVFLICGKICSGKSFYAERLRKEKSAALLSVDEITLALFEQHIGEKHDEICERTQKYLYEKSLEIVEIGCNVILDWGFWQRADRDYAREFYMRRGVSCEFHCVDISEETWRANIAERNKAVAEGRTSAYFVDDNLAAKFDRLFEIPDRSEIDVWYVNERAEEIMLIFPSMKYAEEIIAFKNEISAEDGGFDGCGSLKNCNTAAEWLEQLCIMKSSETCPKGLVPSDTYIAVRKSDGRLVGIIDLRHSLDTPILSEWGGHIGYSVRPDERRKGYGTAMLKMNLENCRRLGLEKVMITCTDGNIASERVIVKNGGKFEKTVEVDGKTIKRYWIALK